MRSRIHLATILPIAVCLLLGASLRAAQAGDAQPAAGLQGGTFTLLPDGTALMLGGMNSDGQIQSSAAIQSPGSSAPVTLSTTLKHPRAWHTATVLPNGIVLILGGLGSDGRVVPTAEVFDPVSRTFRAFEIPPPVPRAFQTATLLTDGRLLLAGGVSENGQILRSAELWDFRQKQSTQVISWPSARRNHTATLLPDGNVLLQGGKDDKGSIVSASALFDTNSQSFVTLDDSQVPQQQPNQLTEVRASSPQDGAMDVPADVLISVRFSSPVNMASIDPSTVTLTGPNGTVNATVVSAEGGMLAFITPSELLLPGTVYSVSLNAAIDVHNANVAPEHFSFTTAGAPSTDPEHWQPNADWRTHAPASPYEKLPLPQAPPGVTALSGRVLRLDGKPLPKVTLKIGSQKAITDENGRFLLAGIDSAHQVLLIDATTAKHGNTVYGLYAAGVEIVRAQTNILPYTIWMTALDTAHEVTIPSPTITETIVRNPSIPGMELRIPAHTVITDYDGKPVTKITMTPIPIDRPPFPLPPSMPVFFTLQPGLSYIHVLDAGSKKKGARIIYPNFFRAPAGTIYNLWDYDAEGTGWFVYGQARVEADQAQIVPFPGAEIYEFSGASLFETGSDPKTAQPIGCKKCKDGEPVDLSTGLFIYNKTDLVVSDVIPLTLTRTYRPNDTVSRAFGIGATHPYDIFLAFDPNGDGTYVDLILPDGGRVHFDCWTQVVGQCTVFRHFTSTTEFYGATLAANGPNNTWQLTMKNGTVMFFLSTGHPTTPFQLGLLSITDRYGNTVTVNRDPYPSSRRATSIVSPNGRSISFTYDAYNRITKATNNGGQTVNYAYDSTGRLVAVADANAAACVANNPSTWMNLNAATGLTVCPTTTYSYDGQHRMTTITDPKGILYLTNVYDGGSYRMKTQTLADGSVYTFSWVIANTNQSRIYSAGSGGGGGGPASIDRYCTSCYAGYMPLVSQADVYYPYPQGDTRNYHRQVKFGNPGDINTGYMTDDKYAVGTSYEQDFHYDYYADNLLQKVTDPLNNVTSYDYDGNGNLTRVTWLDGTSAPATTNYSYDTAGFNQLLSVTEDITSSLRHSYSFSYDNKGNMTAATDPLGNQYKFTFNPAGQMLTASDALPMPNTNTSTFTYNSFGDLVAVTDPLQNTTRFTPDSVGRVLSVTDALNQTTSYQYDSLNQPTQVTDPRGASGITSFTYDPNGNLLAVQDPSQQGTNLNTSYIYDNMDRVVTRTDPLQRQEFYQYDPTGNLTQYTDRRGVATTFQYDTLYRPTSVSFGTESTINYTYDGYDRLLAVADTVAGANLCPTVLAGASICRTFNDLARTYSETTPQGSASYAFDYAGRRKRMTVAGQADINYTFDLANRLTQISQGSANTVISYDQDSRRTSLTLSNNVVTTYCYDNNSRLTGLFYGQATQCSNPSGTLGTLLYGYDAINRRTQAWGTFARTGLPQPVSSASYDAGNELLQWNGQLFSYDLNGNMTSDGTNTYTWNARNQLAQFNAAMFHYDAFGRRSQNLAGTGFFYDDANAVQELSGTTPTANRITGGIDEFFSRSDSTGSYTPIADALGSVIGLTNSSGNITTQYAYDPFGNTTVSGAANSNTAQYTGRENDGNGLYYYRARYYNSSLGRFISQDPVGLFGGLNLYTYVDDSPTNATDGFGLWSTLAHDQILRNAFQPCGVPDREIRQMQRGSHYVDENFQGPEFSYMHLMSDGTTHPPQTPEKTWSKASAFIEMEMRAAKSLYASGDTDRAMFEFGIGAHPLMDVTSSAHTDAQGNPIPWCGFGGCSNLSQHGGDNDFPYNPLSIEDVAHLNARPEVQKTENLLLRSLYEQVTGKKLPAKCHCQ